MAKETLRTVKVVEAAENKAEAVKEQALKKERKMQQESVYSAEELASAARRVFQTTPEIVKTALKRAGKTKATIEETKNIVSKFLSKEVVI